MNGDNDNKPNPSDANADANTAKPVSTMGDPEPNYPAKTEDAAPNTLTADAIAGTKLNEGDRCVIVNRNVRTMRDPLTGDTYYPGIHTRVAKLGVWTIIQIHAGILTIGDDALVGEGFDEANVDYDGLEHKDVPKPDDKVKRVPAAK